MRTGWQPIIKYVSYTKSHNSDSWVSGGFTQDVSAYFYDTLHYVKTFTYGFTQDTNSGLLGESLVLFDPSTTPLFHPMQTFSLSLPRRLLPASSIAMARFTLELVKTLVRLIKTLKGTFDVKASVFDVREWEQADSTKWQRKQLSGEHIGTFSS